LTKAAFARRHGTTARQVYRWIKAGLPVSSGGLVDAAAAVAWLDAQEAGRTRSGREIAAVLEHRAAELLARLRRLVEAHLPAEVVAACWAGQGHEVAALLRAWPTVAAPGLLARLRGEVTDVPGDPRLTNESKALLTRAPASPMAMALAAQESAIAYLAELAETSIASALAPELERRLATARAAVLDGLAEVSHPRARIATVRARLDAFKLAIRRGRWERVNVVGARWAAAVATARQQLLDSAPRLVMQVAAPATVVAMTLALVTAVETSLYELHRGERGPVADDRTEDRPTNPHEETRS
jgi:hypothetical protein